MVKELITYRYECETCGEIYTDKNVALTCEALPIDEATLKIGDFVGVGDHGWWNADTTWTVYQKAPDDKDNWLDVPEDGWRKTPPGPFHPVTHVILPIWKVVGIRRERQSHRLQYMLWCPRHANRVPKRGSGASYGEALNYTYSQNHVTPRILSSEFNPTLTNEEQNRFDELVESLPWDRATLL